MLRRPGPCSVERGPVAHTLHPMLAAVLMCCAQLQTYDPDSLLVIRAARTHPVPSRTRSLSSPAPMILPGRPGGKVGHRQQAVCAFSTPPHHPSRGLNYAKKQARRIPLAPAGYHHRTLKSLTRGLTVTAPYLPPTQTGYAHLFPADAAETDRSASPHRPPRRAGRRTGSLWEG